MSKLEVKRYKLKLLSPLHIGQEDIPFNLLVKLDGEEKIYVLDPLRLSEGLLRISGNNESLVKEATNYIIGEFSKNSNADIDAILKRIVRGDEEKLKQLIKYSSAYSLNFRGSKKIGEEVRSFIRDTYYRPYIPGSSIKGAIRTAFIYKIFKEVRNRSPEFYRKIIERIRNSLKEYEISRRQGKRKKVSSYLDWFERDLVRIFNLHLGQLPVNSEQAAHRDIFRIFRVFDTDPINKDELYLEQVKVFNKGKELNFKIFIEAMPEDTALEFTITYDWGLLDKFVNSNREPFNGYIDFVKGLFKDPIRVTEEFTKDLLSRENSVKDKVFPSKQEVYYFKEPPNLHIGYGGGYLAMTVGLLFEDNEDNLKGEILNFATRSIKRVGVIPSSRRLTSNGRPLGWCKWEEI
ncbi:MAG: type III-A CRISPR-associated RAMP protein Csm5 [candidate division WOR-3 bacterium]